MIFAVFGKVLPAVLQTRRHMVVKCGSPRSRSVAPGAARAGGACGDACTAVVPRVWSEQDVSFAALHELRAQEHPFNTAADV